MKISKKILPKLLAVSFLLLITILAGCTRTTVARGWAGVAVDSGNLYVGSMDGKLIGIDAADRIKLWSDYVLVQPASGGLLGCAPASAPVAIYSTPAVNNDLVFVAGYNGKIYAINSARGVERWRYPREGNISPVVGGITVSDNKLFFGDASGKVYGLDADTGDELWKPFTTGDKIWSAPLAQGDTIYVGSFDKNLYAISVTSGTEKWKYPVEGAIATNPVYFNNRVYFGSLDRNFYAVDAVSGQIVWKSADIAGNWYWAQPVVVDNAIYAPNLDGKVYIFETESGRQVTAPVDLGSSIASSPVAVDNTLVLATRVGKIWGLNTTNNVATLLTDLGKEVNSDLSANGDIVYIHSGADVVNALNVKTGVVLWNFPLTS